MKKENSCHVVINKLIAGPLVRFETDIIQLLFNHFKRKINDKNVLRDVSTTSCHHC